MNHTFSVGPRTIHVGLPIAAAGTIQVGNVIHVDDQSFTVTKVGGAAFDMIPNDQGEPWTEMDDALYDPAAVDKIAASFVVLNPRREQGEQ